MKKTVVAIVAVAVIAVIGFTVLSQRQNQTAKSEIRHAPPPDQSDRKPDSPVVKATARDHSRELQKPPSPPPPASLEAGVVAKDKFESDVKRFIDGAQNLCSKQVANKDVYETWAQYNERKAAAEGERDRNLQDYYRRHTDSATVRVPVKKVRYYAEKQIVSVEAERLNVPGSMTYPPGGGSGRTVPCILCFVVIPSNEASMYVSGSGLNMRLTQAPLSPSRARDKDVIRKKGTFKMIFQFSYDRCQYRRGFSHYDYYFFPALRLVRCDWEVGGECLWTWAGGCSLWTPGHGYAPAAW